MLQQMSSQLGEVATLGRAGDASSGASSDAADDPELPHCKIRRNYNCTKCTYYTQNPRAYLVHTRDVHFVRLKIFDCPNCMYASRHHQKLLRHVKMVHGTSAVDCPKVEMDTSAVIDLGDQDRMEDMLEEIEEIEAEHMDLDENVEDDRFEDFKDEDRTESDKDKGSFFTCDKCHYVTHLRARFTKHVKYHTMPMIKCTICDFRTPYKWNLDRHMRNHGGGGNFTCFMCNFTADIQQSMTVHEMNHHNRSAGSSRPVKRRNRVGASDAHLADVTLQPKEDEGSGDSSDMGLSYTEKDIISCNSDSNEATASEQMLQANRNPLLNEDGRSQSPTTSTDETKLQKLKKIPRPLPQLIPLNSSTPNQKTPPGEPAAKRFKGSPNSEAIDENIGNKIDNVQSDLLSIPLNNGPFNTKDSVVRKKNESFFDKLKERLLTETSEDGLLICKTCGFESKCLSEHSVHEKNCIPLANRSALNTLLPSTSSTRCQNCRHRCKSSADLYNHMRTCKRNMKTEGDTHGETVQQTNEDFEVKFDKEIEPHPMENVVFVWNNINHEQGKFDTPLDISINDDSTLPEHLRNYECETVDDNESMNLSPSQAVGKNVFKCPHCQFWASTASRFHVHIVGHLNKKPFECSLCKYKSNWRWDITKHIKLKSARDPEHNEAKVLMTDETGRRNYSKYNKYLAMPVVNENGESEFHYIDPNTALDGSIEGDEPFNEAIDVTNSTYEMYYPTNNQNQLDNKLEALDIRDQDGKKVKKTLWKCKKCNHKDSSKEALLEHVREHARLENGIEDPKSTTNKKPENTMDPSDLAYRCGHCNQLSNWKHVIQRHCRLKHDGIIKVITTVKPKPDMSSIPMNEFSGEACTKCPFRSNDKVALVNHMLHHQPSANSLFKCFFCPYFVKDEQDLMQHLLVHGVTDPEEYVSKTGSCGSPLSDMQAASMNPCSTKRHKCTECPYETNSKSQYMYHEQFHKLPADTPYKCPECNYSVSKRHLLHQHLRVHGLLPKKSESEADLESMSLPHKSDCVELSSVNITEIPYVWVSAKNEFHKMYKCRYCSYVNSQKCKIPNHEKIHVYLFENTDVTIYKCLECKFTCDNAGRLAEHSKTHGEIYGRIYCPVEENVNDEEQISKLRKVLELEKSNSIDVLPKEDDSKNEGRELKILHFCQKCPSRYFTESELQVHQIYHEETFKYKCKTCDFSIPEEDELISHAIVHSDEYHTKTKMLKFIHNVHVMYREPRLEAIHNPDTKEVTWIAKGSYATLTGESPAKKTTEAKHVAKQFCCKQCPAKFFKSSALSYHMSLHGGDGEHKCKKCSYAVKNVGNLAKHELLHETENKQSNCDYESNEDVDFKNVPISGTDLFQRKTEAQKRVLTDKDKLVKPNDHFPPVLQADPQFGYLMHGNPEFIYPTYLKNGRQKEKRYKCHKCPSAFEKREQYKIHLSLHGSKQRYKCELCDYSVKYYANYVQHMRKHQMNDEAQAERKKSIGELMDTDCQDVKQEANTDNIKLAIKTMPKGVPKSDFQQFSLRDQQTLRLLQRRRSMANTGIDLNATESSPIKERKLHMCILCPYTNQRQDALVNHYKRHDESDITISGSHKCSYCDLVVVQSHFLREHLKTHFNYHKSHTPECFVANQEVSFKIKKLDAEENADLKLDFLQNTKCNDDKIYVNIKTGELLVE